MIWSLINTCVVRALDFALLTYFGLSVVKWVWLSMMSEISLLPGSAHWMWWNVLLLLNDFVILLKILLVQLWHLIVFVWALHLLLERAHLLLLKSLIGWIKLRFKLITCASIVVAMTTVVCILVTILHAYSSYNVRANFRRTWLWYNNLPLISNRDLAFFTYIISHHIWISTNMLIFP